MVEERTGYPDGKERYCRRLGHPVPFRYCRLTADGTPCSSIRECWVGDPELRELAAELAESLPGNSAPPKSAQLYELIRRAREARSGTAE
ncbi:hypothetical protein [Marispirochaeta aestuarii]|uniref:hypothetical protein n=1 Tax=Marispirochaeta aestuarii TaxID=1963862 RepID=UPI0029C77E12|nr:hypothetical protein [Marispirochaeta aestuarii]